MCPDPQVHMFEVDRSVKQLPQSTLQRMYSESIYSLEYESRLIIYTWDDRVLDHFAIILRTMRSRLFVVTTEVAHSPFITYNKTKRTANNTKCTSQHMRSLNIFVFHKNQHLVDLIEIPYLKSFQSD